MTKRPQHLLMLLLLAGGLCQARPAIDTEAVDQMSDRAQCAELMRRHDTLGAEMPCRRAAAAGDFGSLLLLGNLDGHAPRYDAALAAAQKGDAAAALYLGEALLLSRVPPVVEAHDRALYWLNHAASRGLARADYWIGVAYAYGRFPSANRDLPLAKEHLSRASARGDRDATLLLAQLGLYLHQLPPTAVLSLLTKVEPVPRGSDWGWVFENGVGAVRDPAKAEALYWDAGDLLGAFRGLQLLRARAHEQQELQQAAQRLAKLALIDHPEPWLTAAPMPHGDACRLLAGLLASGAISPLSSSDSSREVAMWYRYAGFYDQRNRPSDP